MAEKAARKAPSGQAGPRKGSSVVEEVRQLVQLMVDHELSEVDITDGARKILLKRRAAVPPAPVAAPAAPAPAAPSPPAAPEPAPEELIEIKSPMVGTFYAAPSPDSDPYVAVGYEVDEDTVVCIVEAMKVMNEVRAECSWTIAEICIKNAQQVEYGQVLFRVRPR